MGCFLFGKSFLVENFELAGFATEVRLFSNRHSEIMMKENFHVFQARYISTTTA